MLIYALLVVSLLEGSTQVATIYCDTQGLCNLSRLEAVLTDNVLFAECRPTWYF